MQRSTVLFMAMFCLLTSAVRSQTEQELREAVRAAHSDVEHARALVDLGEAIKSTKAEEAVRYAQQGLAYCRYPGNEREAQKAYRTLGYVAYIRANYPEAIRCWRETLRLNEINRDSVEMARTCSNLGAVYESVSNDSLAMSFCLRSLAVSEKLRDTARMVAALTNIGVIHGKKPATYAKASTIYQRALKLVERRSDPYQRGGILINLGEIYQRQNNDSIALDYYTQASADLAGSDFSPYCLVKIGDLYLSHGELFRADSVLQIAESEAQRMQLQRDQAIALISIAKVRRQQGRSTDAIQLLQRSRDILLQIGVMEDLRDVYKELADVYEHNRQPALALMNYKLFTKVSDSVYNTEIERKVANQVFDHELRKKQDEITLLNKDREIAERESVQQRTTMYASLGGVGLVSTLMLVVFRSYRRNVRTGKQLEAQRSQIEELLHSILPSTVVHELRDTGVSVPRSFDSATVLFTDVEGFTRIVDGMSPSAIIDELNTIFTAYDEITSKYGLERIKTIGDAYMCVGGISGNSEMHALNMVRAAAEISAFMDVRNNQRRLQGLAPWKIRIGIHTGPVAAGVIGKKKYAYDVWGGTVNIASRVESNGEAGRINVSGATYEQIKHEYSCSYRGKINARNIGEIDMYFVERSLRPS